MMQKYMQSKSIVPAAGHTVANENSHPLWLMHFIMISPAKLLIGVFVINLML